MLKNVQDTSVVTVQPKSYVGSSGSLHASNLIKIRAQNPELFDEACENRPDPVICKAAAYLTDTLNYFKHTSIEKDVRNVKRLPHCKHRAYELKRVESLKTRLNKAYSDLLIDKENNMIIYRMAELVDGVVEKADQLITCLDELDTTSQVWLKCKAILMSAEEFLLYVNTIDLPSLRKHVLEFTDAGAGVGSSNLEVQYR